MTKLLEWEEQQFKYAEYLQFPVNRRCALLESGQGKKFGYSLQQLARVLATGQDFGVDDIYVVCTPEVLEEREDLLKWMEVPKLKPVLNATEEYCHLLATAGVLINEDSFPHYFIKREEQTYLRTWNGIPMRKSGRYSEKEAPLIGNTQRNILCADYFVCPNEFTMEPVADNYMLSNIGTNTVLFAGRFQNEILFDETAGRKLREKYGLGEKRISLYVPTFCGAAGSKERKASEAALWETLRRLDDCLTEEHLVYVSAPYRLKDEYAYASLKHVAFSPRGCSLLRIMAVAENLIVDASGLVFDFAVTRNKIVLFSHDRELAEVEKYYAFHGTLPFSRAASVEELTQKLNNAKEYEDEAFYQTYCRHDGAGKAEAVLRKALLGEEVPELETGHLPDNGKENVLIYPGALFKNGITMSLFNLLHQLDTSRYNFILFFRKDYLELAPETLKDLPQGMSFYVYTKIELFTPDDEKIKDLELSYEEVRSLFYTRVWREYTRQLAFCRIDTAVHYEGYTRDILGLFEIMPCRRLIFCHNNMLLECENKGIRPEPMCRAYHAYEAVALVSEEQRGLAEQMVRLDGGNPKDSNIALVSNLIPYERILTRSKETLLLDEKTELNVPEQKLRALLASNKKKFITIGRFHPEKGHARLITAFEKIHRNHPDTALVILGGYGPLYEETVQQAAESSAAEDIAIIQYLSNPYALLAACDYFVLSSHYEGFGVVLMEADIVGLPCISTDIAGPHDMLTQYGGLLVEDSEAGLAEGMLRCISGQAPERFRVDYATYNAEAVHAFEALLQLPKKEREVLAVVQEQPEDSRKRSEKIILENKEGRQPNFFARQNYAWYREQLPIDEKRILVEALEGAGPSVDIAALVRELNNNPAFSEFQIYLSGKAEGYQARLSYVKKQELHRVEVLAADTDVYYQVLATAKYLVNETAFSHVFIKRPEQVYLNLWSGTPFKKVGRQAKNDYAMLGNLQKNFFEADYLLYPNTFVMGYMVRDYMLSNFGRGKVLLCGAPRNEVFFDAEHRERLRGYYGLEDEVQHIAFMPMWRGAVGYGNGVGQNAQLKKQLDELEHRLSEKQMLYVKLHTANATVDLSGYTKIKPFPTDVDSYAFLHALDVLVTDYSEVMFDFAVTGRKIVLFTPDLELYEKEKGHYLSLRDVPFAKVQTTQELVQELAVEKTYDDTVFLQKFCAYEKAGVTQALLNKLVFSEESGLFEERPLPYNGKKNVLLYLGGLAKNSLTDAAVKLMRQLNTERYNFAVVFQMDDLRKRQQDVKVIPEGIDYHGFYQWRTADPAENEDYLEWKVKRTVPYAKVKNLMQRMCSRERLRMFAPCRVDGVVQYSGYYDEVTAALAQMPCKRSIYVYRDMAEVCREKKNMDIDFFADMYAEYDMVGTLSEDISEATMRLLAHDPAEKNVAKLKVCQELIDAETVLAKAKCEPALDGALVHGCKERLYEILEGQNYVFVTKGTLTEDKGVERLLDAFELIHEENDVARLLILADAGGIPEQISEKLEKLNGREAVMIVENVQNPYAFMTHCDTYVSASYYEGLGNSLAQADVLGLSCIATDVPGNHAFMKKYGGTLVKSSVYGLFRGMQDCLAGKVSQMKIDFEQYNKEALAQFEALLP